MVVGVGQAGQGDQAAGQRLARRAAWAARAARIDQALRAGSAVLRFQALHGEDAPAVLGPAVADAPRAFALGVRAGLGQHPAHVDRLFPHAFTLFELRLRDARTMPAGAAGQAGSGPATITVSLAFPGRIPEPARARSAAPAR
ncbi:MAG: hypothetical protein MO847_07815 [Candidatus Protistobacter heckmanni]|nr:hypothetical protein [Candidatus Protistobacter heckmanni]